jgi:hypothetical protein
LLVAGWITVDKPWPTLLPWLEPFDWESARVHIGHSVLLISDNDPYTSNSSETASLFESRLASTVVIERDAKHFNANEEPAVLRELQRLIA